MRRLRSSFFSNCPFLVVTRPRTIIFPFGTNRSGSNVPERVVVVFEKQAVHLELVEHRFGNRVVAAGRNPRRAMIAATGMHAYGHGRWLARQRLVDQLDVGQVTLVGIAGGRANLVAIGRIAERCEHRVVDLKIGAAELLQDAVSARHRPWRDRERAARRSW